MKWGKLSIYLLVAISFLGLSSHVHASIYDEIVEGGRKTNNLHQDKQMEEAIKMGKKTTDDYSGIKGNLALDRIASSCQRIEFQKTIAQYIFAAYANGQRKFPINCLPEPHEKTYIMHMGALTIHYLAPLALVDDGKGSSLMADSSFTTEDFIRRVREQRVYLFLRYIEIKNASLYQAVYASLRPYPILQIDVILNGANSLESCREIANMYLQADIKKIEKDATKSHSVRVEQTPTPTSPRLKNCIEDFTPPPSPSKILPLPSDDDELLEEIVNASFLGDLLVRARKTEGDLERLVKGFEKIPQYAQKLCDFMKNPHGLRMVEAFLHVNEFFDKIANPFMFVSTILDAWKAMNGGQDIEKEQSSRDLYRVGILRFYQYWAKHHPWTPTGIELEYNDLPQDEGSNIYEILRENQLEDRPGSGIALQIMETFKEITEARSDTTLIDKNFAAMKTLFIKAKEEKIWWAIAICWDFQEEEKSL